jgi:hypothetical protein
MGTFFGFKLLPTADAVERIKTDITAAIDREDYTSVPSLAAAGLRIAPLDWLLYYKRGVADVALSRPRDLALRDFGAANYLNPLWPDLCLHEGQAWLAVGEVDLAIEAWAETLRRARDRAPNFYADMVGSVKGDPVMLDRLRQLADDNNALLITFLRAAGSFEFRIEAERLISENRQLRSFSSAELVQFFAEWYEKGDKLELAENLRAHPEWLKIGWKQLARVYADYQDYRQAYETVLKFIPPPNLSARNSDEPMERLAARFQVNQTDVENGLALYQAQIKNGQTDAALVTLQKLSAAERSPKYLSYLEAQLWAQNGQWKNAWEAVARFESIGR